MAKNVLNVSRLLTPWCFSTSFCSPEQSTPVVPGESEVVLRNADSDETALVSDYYLCTKIRYYRYALQQPSQLFWRPTYLAVLFPCNSLYVRLYPPAPLPSFFHALLFHKGQLIKYALYSRHHSMPSARPHALWGSLWTLALSPDAQWQRRKPDHSHLTSSSKVKNKWSYTSTPPQGFMTYTNNFSIISRQPD
jgi:hypothetical protein